MSTGGKIRIKIEIQPNEKKNTATSAATMNREYFSRERQKTQKLHEIQQQQKIIHEIYLFF